MLRQFTGDGAAYRKLRRVECVYLPKICDVSTDSDGQVTVLEEYIEGENLAEILKARRLTNREARKIMCQLCRALQTLHKADIVHRDIKPDNIILREDRVCLVDFDAARLYEPGTATDTQVLGTVGYAAPEQYGISQSDKRTDIYAMGVLLNVMLTGKHPAVGRLASGPMRKIIQRCTMMNPDDRYQSASQLLRELHFAAWRPWTIVAAAVVLAAVVIVSGSLIQRRIAASNEAPDPTHSMQLPQTEPAPAVSEEPTPEPSAAEDVPTPEEPPEQTQGQPLEPPAQEEPPETSTESPVPPELSPAQPLETPNVPEPSPSPDVSEEPDDEPPATQPTQSPTSTEEPVDNPLPTDTPDGMVVTDAVSYDPEGWDRFPVDVWVELPTYVIHNRFNGEPSEGVTFTRACAMRSQERIVTFVVEFVAEQTFQCVAFEPPDDLWKIVLGTISPKRTSVSFSVPVDELKEIREIGVILANSSGRTGTTPEEWNFSENFNALYIEGYVINMITS